MNTLQQTLLEQIRGNRRDGSTRVADQAIAALADYAERAMAISATRLLAELQELARAMAQCRISMVAIGTWVEHWQQALDAGTRALDNDAVRQARNAAQWALKQTRLWANQATEATVSATVACLQQCNAVLTHSNSTTVRRTLETLARPGLHVLVTESRPGLEGRDLALALAKAGATVTYLTDAAATSCLNQVDAVLVGADAVLADGSIVNKVGSYALALAAHDQHKDFIVSAEPFKHSALTATEFPLEHQDPAELKPPAHPRIRGYNPYFDITPADLVTRHCQAWGSQRD